MALNVIFIIFMVLILVPIIFSIRAKRLNLGFTFTAVILLVCDFLCLLILNSTTLRSARNTLQIYYIVYSWMFFFSLLTIVRSYYGKTFSHLAIVMGSMSAILTALVIFAFNAPQRIIISKQAFFGRMFWIAQGKAESGGFSPFLFYCILSAIAGAFLVACLIYYLIKSYSSSRGKYIILLAFQAILSIMVILTYTQKWPIWIHTLVMNPMCYFTYFYIFLSTDIKLKNDVITTFANEMTDGLLLYNADNRLIFVNDFIKDLIDDAFLLKLEDISETDNWISATEEVESMSVVPYKTEEKELFFKASKQVLQSGQILAGTVYILHNSTPTVHQIRMMEQVNKELEETSRMKSDFLANMSHEIRTPMNAVIGMADLALRETNSPQVDEYLTQISRAGKNLLSIINDILDFSKIDAGKLEIFPEKYEPLSEINDVANILQSRIGTKELELFFDADEKLPHALLGDAARIRQILINLANNAIKFTEKGVIKIVLRCEQLSEDKINLVFHVLDNGQGIKKEDLDKLFISFNQLDSRRNRSVEGTGLGLAISKKLCEAMDGTIGVESEYGKGSDFWFSIPQTIVDGTRDLVIEDAANKVAFVLNERRLMTKEFSKELSKYGVKAVILNDLPDYKPTGKQDFLFIEDNLYTPTLEAFLDKNPNLVCVVLTGFGSNFATKRKNVRIMKKPQTSLAMVLILNNRSFADVLTHDTPDDPVFFEAEGARVLVVDDTAINLDIVTGLLEPTKIEVVTAQSGADAIEKLKGSHFDLILMDHMMPGMDGIDTTKAIRNDIPSADDTPIIALTANVVEGSKDMFLKAGMVDLIPKPIDSKLLNSKLAEWLPKDKVKKLTAEEIEKAAKEAGGGAADDELFSFLECDKAIELLGSVKLFKKVVEDYYKKGPETLETIEAAKADKNWSEYAIKAHALKSSSRQIGHFELGSLAEKLEHAGKAEDIATIEEYHETTMNTFKQLLSDLSKHFDSADKAAEDLPSITEEELKDIFEALKNACGELDMDAMEDCENRLKGFALPAGKKEIFEELFSAIENVDVEKCIEIADNYK